MPSTRQARSLLLLGVLAGCGEGSERPSSSRDATSVMPADPADSGPVLADGSSSDLGFVDARVLEPDAAAPDAFEPDPDPCSGSGCGPRILSLSANVTTLRSDQLLIITAVVSDPDGIDDLIGGTLTDPSTGGTYGAFQTSASEGAYALTLSWADLDTVRTIDAPKTGVSRELVARFFDVAGQATEGRLQVDLRCADDAHAACGGECLDLETSSTHCGRCGSPAPAGTYCEGGAPRCFGSSEELCGTECADLATSTLHCGICGHACPSYAGRSVSCWDDGVCSVLDTENTRVSCDSVCAPSGYVCGWTQWVYGSGADTSAVIGTCSALPPASDAEGRLFAYVNCGCRHYPPSNGCALGPENTVAACTDECSNDGDRYTDCEDFDCCPLVSCAPGTACGDR